MRFGKVIFQRVLRVASEGIIVREAVREILRNAGPEFSWLRKRGVRAKWHKVKRAEAHSDFNFVPVCANARNNFAQNASPVFKRAAESPGTRLRAQELVQQVTVAMLDVDEICAYIPGDPGGANIALDQLLDLRIGEHLFIAGHLELLVQNWMAIRHARFHPELIDRLAESARVGELKANHQIVRSPIALLVGPHKNFA